MHTARLRGPKGQSLDVEVSHLPNEEDVRDHLKKQFPDHEILAVLPADPLPVTEPGKPLAPPPKSAPAVAPPGTVVTNIAQPNVTAADVQHPEKK